MALRATFEAAPKANKPCFVFQSAHCVCRLPPTATYSRLGSSMSRQICQGHYRSHGDAKSKLSAKEFHVRCMDFYEITFLSQTENYQVGGAQA